jgi:hypothetical protein
MLSGFTCQKTRRLGTAVVAGFFSDISHPLHVVVAFSAFLNKGVAWKRSSNFVIERLENIDRRARTSQW